MEDNVITLDPVRSTLQQEITQHQQRELALQEQEREKQQDVFRIEASLINLTAAQKREAKTLIASIKGEIKLIQGDLKQETQKRQAAERKLAQLIGQENRVFARKTSEHNAQKVFDENNIYFVMFDQQWWSVDATGSRMDIKVNRSDYQVIRDVIYYETDWEITSEQELKRIAKSLGRTYKHIVRDFNPTPRKGIYNQMTDIRKNWLEPLRDQPPHDAFRVLTMSIAGGNAEYADQLERYVAYRYCHPHDINIPNIDSCATGGTGRDTLWSIITTIFTYECCGSASEETFRGTHNGDLFGKMFVKVDEKDNNKIPIDKLKEYTGNDRYRHRQMNQDARDAVRLFTFFMFRNGYTTTARLNGAGGSSGEDRRWEPIIARHNLNRHLAKYVGLIDDLNTELDREQTAAIQMYIKEWQRDYYKNETEVARWLGHIIDKYDAPNMRELLPLHGVYYTEMLDRQKRGVDGFMPRFWDLMRLGHSTVIKISDAQKIYELVENTKVSKDWFKNQVKYWLNTHANWDSDERVCDVYLSAAGTARTKIAVIVDRLRTYQPTERIWDLEDFVDYDAEDEKGNTSTKPQIYNIRDQLR